VSRFAGRSSWLPSLLLCSLLLISGCGKRQIDKALDSDANGYACLDCGAKFYTEREVFASFCPQCKKPAIQQVLGFVCPVDKHVTIDARGRGARGCEKCGKPTGAVSIPTETQLKAWGAAKKTAAEVGG
jgi:hypothetical protein